MSAENIFREKIINIDVTEEMQKSYIEYAMSIIVARALPDVRDGLKPVHRRILFAMSELNLEPNKAYKKSARIVGDTMGKFHPHGELAIYDALVRMAQEFTMRYCLVDGHGNFGSMDGDGAAAQRYTEARLERLAAEMLSDIEKDTVDFIDNYDGEFKEPTVLPSRFPNLLVNGSSGIAVGMSTEIPPHNLTDVINAVIKIIDDAAEGIETDIADLIEIIKAPDFPTGGAILGLSGARQAYRTGRGKVVIRAAADIVPMPGAGSREMIVVREVPYRVNKARMIKHMGELVNDKKIEGITDIRDESNREGVRVVIELRAGVNSGVILNQLYKFSSLQETFNIIMLALSNGEPKILNLSEMLNAYISHQKEVITRRVRFDLNKAETRAHILEGYIKALDHIDEVIAIIRASSDAAEAREKLSERFGFTEAQASAIVDMRLRALTGLEKEKLLEEYREIMLLIDELKAILNDEKLLYRVLKEELLIIQTKFGDERRTAIIHDETEILDEDLIEPEENVITLSNMNYIKRIPLDTYKSQNRGGKGIMGMQTREEDWVRDLFVANTLDDLLFFTSRGRVFRMKAYRIPEAGRTARGLAIVNLLNLDGAGETLSAVIPVATGSTGPGQEGAEDFLTMITRRGVIKKTAISQFANIKKGGLIALNIRDDDDLIAVLRTNGSRDLLLTSKRGMGIRFPESGVRPMGRSATGVKAMNLRGGDEIVGADAVDGDSMMLMVSANGFGKCTFASAFRGQRRGGTGMAVYKSTAKTGPLVGNFAVTEKDELMIINSEGTIIRIRVADISVQGRVASGVKLIQMDGGVTVAGMARIKE
ncbi:MAG: DNA gyrase subunit A [Defluviitaleaceae bacterium]|nr:DNA gyrase subunit A [Defluviitaleaceae bacterium]